MKKLTFHQNEEKKEKTVLKNSVGNKTLKVAKINFNCSGILICDSE